MKELTLKRYFFTFIAILILWLLAYGHCETFATWSTSLIFNPNEDIYYFQALQFFIYDSIKILLLLSGLVYLMGLLRANLNTQKVRDYLLGKKKIYGYFLGSLFGAITPFCSCSSVPLFIGFTVARIPIGITMSFLITSPILNQVAVVLMFGILGIKFTALYIFIAILCGILGGFFFDAIKAQRFLQPFILDAMAKSNNVKAQNINMNIESQMTLLDRHQFAKEETLTIVKRVYKWIFVGVAIGSVIHGFVPREFFIEYASSDNIFAVPLAVFMGLPLYTNVTGILPIMESLLTKGLPVGTTLAFCLSSVAASIPEFVMLKQVMKWKMLFNFYAFLFIVFIFVGYLFNFIF